MTDEKELRELIRKAEKRGATVKIEYDLMAEFLEGSKIIESIQISGLKGFGPFPMSPIVAAERLREL